MSSITIERGRDYYYDPTPQWASGDRNTGRLATVVDEDAPGHVVVDLYREPRHSYQPMVYIGRQTVPVEHLRGPWAPTRVAVLMAALGIPLEIRMAALGISPR